MLQESAVNEFLLLRKAAHVQDIARWWQKFHVYTEAVKMDRLRMLFLQEAGVPNVQPQVRMLLLQDAGLPHSQSRVGLTISVYQRYCLQICPRYL